jgi:hypothetical protein
MIPTSLINTAMETCFQKDRQPAGPSERDNRRNSPAKFAVGRRKGADRELRRQQPDGAREAVQDENAAGDNGNANYSWFLQL